jgi:hypothetical protein
MEMSRVVPPNMVAVVPGAEAANWRCLQAPVFAIPPLGSNPSHEKQYDDDDQDDTDDTDATVTESVTIAAEPAAEATEQENDEDDNEDGSQRHDLSPVAAPIQQI